LTISRDDVFMKAHGTYFRPGMPGRRHPFWSDLMTHTSLSFRLAVFGLGAVVALSAGEAFAIKQFFDEFKEMYVKEGSPLAAEVETAKCNVCHKGKSKKDRNAYGEALAKLLDKKEDKKNVKKIRQALETVAAESSDPADAAAPTFGDLIAAGKLPGGPAE
jgi:hypothetical protein